MSKKQYHYYPKNTFFLESKVNVTFEEVLKFSKEQFEQWVVDFRKEIVDIWDNKGVPPLNGYSKSEIIDQFTALEGHPVHKMFVKSEEGYQCIRNTHNKLGNACNSWFPTMMKTKIDYGNANPRSIYDFMALDELLPKYMPYAYRHFKRDSFYAYSQCITLKDKLPTQSGIKIDSAIDWVRKFRKHEYQYKKYDFWLQETDKDKDYTGYNEDLIDKEFLSLTEDEVRTLISEGHIWQDDYTLSNIDHLQADKKYMIRFFKLGQKIFPVGLKSFRVSVCQSAVNFPPVIAKAVWERYTADFKDDERIYVWDPSSGWGGRILGAMAVDSDKRSIMYLGNDPNTDHTITKEYSSGGYGMPDREFIYTKYDDLATFYNTQTGRARSLFPNLHKWKFWQLGSEMMQHDPAFQEYKGKLSVVFTSPPYFSKEVYSQDPEQSCHKFTSYDAWRDEFLYETLKTAYEWLRPGGYICWNIADVTFGKDTLPLQTDSERIMREFGMEYVEELKMVLGQMPGGNRTMKDEEGNLVSTNKNSIRLNGAYFRYEPIIVFRKK